MVSRVVNDQIVLFDSYLGPQQVQLLQVSMNLGAMAMKEYSIFPKASGLEPHYQTQFSIITRTFVGEGVLPL